MEKKGFTFIEILVVVTIISLLSAIGMVSYAQFSKQSRDARRKADLEQIRAAAEMYKSNNGSYPTGASLGGLANISTDCNPGAISDATSTYLSKIPNDPRCTASVLTYSYASTDGSSYTVGTLLEIAPVSGATCSGCGTSSCNYCVGPYGQL